jgi:hypothetical protein
MPDDERRGAIWRNGSRHAAKFGAGIARPVADGMIWPASSRPASLS